MSQSGVIAVSSIVGELLDGASNSKIYGHAARFCGARWFVGMRDRPLKEIAQEVRGDWKHVSVEAESLLGAMEQADPVTDRFRGDSGIEILAKFRWAARTWHGPVAQKIKREIDEILRSTFSSR
jgi:hypothetical protein